MKILYASVDDVNTARVKQFASIGEMLTYVSTNQKEYPLSADALSIMPVNSPYTDDYDMGVFDASLKTVQEFGFPQLVGYCKIGDDVSVEDYKRAVLGTFQEDKKYRGSEIRSIADKIQQGESIFKAQDSPDPPKTISPDLRYLLQEIGSEITSMHTPSSGDFKAGFERARMSILNLIEDIFSEAMHGRMYGRRYYEPWRDDHDDVWFQDSAELNEFIRKEKSSKGGFNF